MGHGTAVPGHFDIDLVIYSRGKNAFYFSSNWYLSVCALLSISLSLTHTHSLAHFLSVCVCVCLCLCLCLSLSLSLCLYLLPLSLTPLLKIYYSQ